ncbi:type II secretion system F family protein [Cellulomonas sp. P22]|uniref:type II secretion system F family protein n=1 Tax=Cellulomonas sp. P22 TaxID=3373189 RepID=UPI0037A2A8D1
MSAVVGLLVAGAVLAVRGPRGRPVRRAAARPRAPLGGRLLDRLTGRTDGTPQPTLVEVLAMVSASLRAGRTPVEAWRATGVVTATDGVPAPGALLVVGARASGGRTRGVPGRGGAFGRRGAPGGWGDRHVRHVVAVHAAARLAARLGAPLAPVLDRVAEAIVVDDEVEAERRAALAGPRSTAIVLGWLPVLGVLLGYGLGADPLRVMLDGGVGSLSALLGAVLLVAGRWWTARMLAGARAAGAPR